MIYWQFIQIIILVFSHTGDAVQVIINNIKCAHAYPLAVYVACTKIIIIVIWHCTPAISLIYSSRGLEFLAAELRLNNDWIFVFCNNLHTFHSGN